MSNIYYCHNCALNQKIITPLAAENYSLTGSVYLLDKFIKHTSPPNLNGLISVYNDPNYDQIKNYTVSTSASGSVEINNSGKVNIVYYANSNIGITYKNGNFLSDADTVKVVYHNNALKIHSFPVDSFEYEKKKCKICDRDIIW